MRDLSEFEAVRASVPPTAPESWEVTARSPAPDAARVDVSSSIAAMRSS